MNMTLSTFEYHGPHLVHERAERAEQAMTELQSFITSRRAMWVKAFGEDSPVAQELAVILAHAKE